MKNIHKCIEKNLVQFTKDISDKYGMSQDDLLEMWTSVSKMKMKSGNGSSTKKMSPWLQFCKDERIKLKIDEPSLKFGEISKRIGEKWSAMSKEEKKQYESSHGSNSTAVVVSTNTTTMEDDDERPSQGNASIATPKSKKNKKNSTTTVATASAVAPPQVVGQSSTDTSEKWTRDGLEKMSISELKELCESIKLSKTGKKTVLVDRLLNCSEYTMTTTTTTNNSPDEPSTSTKDDEIEDGHSSDSEDEGQSGFEYDYSSD
jgi:hypothetical protein